jgi:hypothetical protein
MMREPAHRRDVGGALAAGGQCQIEGFARDFGILVEHLVEVAHAKEKDRSGVLTLERAVLPEHGGEGRGVLHEPAKYTSEAPAGRA